MTVASGHCKGPRNVDEITVVGQLSLRSIHGSRSSSDCTLRLDDRVDDLLPELAEMAVLADPNGPLEHTVAARRAITLRDLLTCTLGTGMVNAEPGTIRSPTRWTHLAGLRQASRTPASACGARASPGWRRRTSATNPPPASRLSKMPPNGRWSRPPAFESGGGGLVSTADD
jgi:hypothetical protein